MNVHPPTEVYSLGFNQRLPQSQKDLLRLKLEDKSEKTSDISQLVTSKPLDINDSSESLIESYIERSRKTMFERIKSKS